MLLVDLQIIIEAILILVIIIGIIISRSIVKRLSVVRETYNALTQMVANLDSSTEHAGRLFEAMQQESFKGGKKLSALVEYARNATEDLQDLQKMTTESSTELDRNIKQADEARTALLEAINQAQQNLSELASDLASMKSKSRDLQKSSPDRFDQTLDDAKEAVLSDSSSPVVTTKIRTFSPSEKVSDLPPEEEISQAKFSDKIEGPIPQALREPRPYLSVLEKK